MTAKKLGRPKKDERPNATVLSIRNVDRDMMKQVRIYAVQQDLTIGEALSELVKKALQHEQNHQTVSHT